MGHRDRHMGVTQNTVPPAFLLVLLLLGLILPCGADNYVRETLAREAAKELKKSDADTTMGRRERFSVHAGHKSNGELQMMEASALASLNITDEQLQRIDSLRTQAVQEMNARKQMSSKVGMMLSVGNSTLQRMRNGVSLVRGGLATSSKVADKVGKHVKSHLKRIVGDRLSGCNQTEFSELSTTIRHGNSTIAVLGDDKRLCNTTQVPELPILIKWLVGLDTATSQGPTPGSLRIMRNVVMVVVVVLVIMCAAFCVGRRLWNPSPSSPAGLPGGGGGSLRALPNQRITIRGGSAINVFNPHASMEVARHAKGTRSLIRGRVKAALE